MGHEESLLGVNSVMVRHAPPTVAPCPAGAVGVLCWGFFVCFSGFFETLVRFENIHVFLVRGSAALERLLDVTTR